MLMIFFSKDLRRNLKGVMKAAKDLLLLVLLYIIVISTFSFIGINLIG
jgi:two pore calcium channel protein 1/two pore calcium channel protein 3